MEFSFWTCIVDRVFPDEDDEDQRILLECKSYDVETAMNLSKDMADFVSID